jgi:amino acid transporter
VFATASVVFFSFVGFDIVASVSEETLNPTRSGPMMSAGRRMRLLGGGSVALSASGRQGLGLQSVPLLLPRDTS